MMGHFAVPVLCRPGLNDDAGVPQQRKLSSKLDRAAFEPTLTIATGNIDAGVSAKWSATGSTRSCRCRSFSPASFGAVAYDVMAMTPYPAFTEAQLVPRREILAV